MSAELIIKLDTAPANIGDKERDAIETAARAIAMSMKALGFSEDFRTTRAKLIESANTEIKTVLTHEELEAAVVVLRDMSTFKKEVETEEEKLKQSLHRPKSALMKVFESEMAAFAKARDRVTDMVTGYQREQVRIKEDREREARAVQLKAEADARKAQEEQEAAQRALDAAKTAKAREAAEDALLDAQLKQESAALQSEQASAQLALPTNTPSGLVTKARFDFAVIDAHKCARTLIGTWLAHDGNETLKIDRAGLLKQLNASEDNAAHKLLPPEGQQSIAHTDLGIRIFRDVSIHTR